MPARQAQTASMANGMVALRAVRRSREQTQLDRGRKVVIQNWLADNSVTLAGVTGDKTHSITFSEEAATVLSLIFAKLF